ncbi:cyclic nucleotide-binding protein [Ferroglobus placidus DSM 10642]|uniref:Cyclic nucleotide-binding protein n=1 Tax=Ferroglobus placidus (strain DSM 10642 / AEDII12DO) TaxID=589924 RepID=D3RY49_FERPA|nr:DUF58 domain-containing protein [Ferroglobus placidus]ADC65412.1 cyclic nucleotide-binding protein [Ferroglobus placidus DSM 10642]
MKYAASKAVSAAVFLLLVGVVLIIPEFVLAALVPLTPLLVPPVARIKVDKVEFEKPEYIGEEFRVSIPLKFYGIGIAKIYHEIEEGIEIIDGKNYSTAFIFGFGKSTIRYRGRVRRIGKHDLSKLKVVVENLSLSSERMYEIDLDLEIEAKSRIFGRRLKELRAKAKSVMVDIDRAKIGVPGTDFKEIREYNFSDPLKFINWKASARLGKLMVNEFEKEGKKAVWIVLDANDYMEGFFDKALEVCSFLVSYYATRGNKVGLYALGKGNLIYPDFGKKQVKKIFDYITSLEADGSESLEESYEKMKKMLYIYEPLIYIITRAEKANLKKFIRKVSKFKVVVISIKRDGESLGELALMLARRRALKGIEHRLEIDVEDRVEKLAKVVA